MVDDCDSYCTSKLLLRQQTAHDTVSLQERACVSSIQHMVSIDRMRTESSDVYNNNVRVCLLMISYEQMCLFMRIMMIVIHNRMITLKTVYCDDDRMHW
jgi:hypothetical protein